MFALRIVLWGTVKKAGVLQIQSYATTLITDYHNA